MKKQIHGGPASKIRGVESAAKPDVINRPIHAWAWGATTILVFLIEWILLEKKYNAFSGGFLQANQIVGLDAYFEFLGLLLLINGLFYGTLASLWLVVATRIGARSSVSAYNLLALMLGASLVLIGARYQLNTYFGDFLTFSVIRNLGGGTVSGALGYAVNEGVIALAVLAGIVIIWMLGLRFIARHSVQSPGLTQDWASWLWPILGASFVVVIYYSNLIPNFCPHFAKTTVFLNSRELLQFVTDVDGDGYSPFSWPQDTDNFNSSVYPGQLDIPENGIDEDGLAGDFHFVAEPKQIYRYTGEKKHVILIVLESLRSDALTQKVGAMEVMPTVRKLAQNGSSSTQYYSHTGFTTSSLTAVFTGAAMAERSSPVLLNTLQKAGYEISTVSGQNESFGDIAVATGTRQFSDHYYDASLSPDKRAYYSATAGSLVVSNEEVIQRFAGFANTVNWKRPQFFYINFQSAHFPYFYQGMKLITTQKPLARSDVTYENSVRVQDTYWNAAANADDSVRAILSELESRKVLEKSLVVVIGDHGEALFEDRLLGHGFKISKVQMQTIFAANVPGLGHPEPFGHRDLADVIIRGSGAEAIGDSATARQKPVLHIVGSLERPNQIGHTLADGRLIVLSPSSLTYEVISNGKSALYSRLDINADPSLKAAFDRLVEDWESERWVDYLNKTASFKAVERAPETK